MPRGRHKRVIQATLPPKGFYRGRVAVLKAVRDRAISRSACTLWQVVAMFSWDRGRCDLTNEALARWMGGVTTETIRRLLGELQSAGLLRIYDRSGHRALEPLEGYSSSVEPDSLGTAASPPAADFYERYYAHTNLAQIEADRSFPKEEVDHNHDLRPAAYSSKGGAGGMNCAQTSLAPNQQAGNSQQVDELVSLLRGVGVFKEPSRQLAAELLEKMPYPNARRLVLGHIFDLRREGIHPQRLPGLLLWRVRNAEPTRWALEQVETLQGFDNVRKNGSLDRSLKSSFLQENTVCRHPEQQLWEKALSELQCQMARAIFDAWLRGTKLVSLGNGIATIAVRSEHAKAWLEGSFKDLIKRTLEGLTDQSLQVRFEVEGDSPISDHPTGRGDCR